MEKGERRRKGGRDRQRERGEVKRRERASSKGHVVCGLYRYIYNPWTPNFCMVP